MRNQCMKVVTMLGAFCLFASAQADQSDSSSKNKNNANNSNAKPERVITPNAGPKVDGGADLFITADFIWWTAREEGLDYASTGVLSAGGATGGKVHEPDFNYRPGFKVGLGLDLDHDGWDIYANYTWLRTGDRTSSVSSAASDILVLWQTPAPGFDTFADTATSASSTWNFHLNVVDLELGRNFFVSKRLTLRPHFGLKGTWQKQTYSVAAANATPVSLSQNFKQNNWGIGIRGGLQTGWQFSRCWGIYGDLALSGMWSRYKDTRSDSQTDDGVTTTYLSNKYHTHTVSPVLEMGIGFAWDIWFNDDSYHFGIKAGWEEQVWWGANHFFGAFDRGNHGNLTTQGLTAGLRFDF